MTTTNMTYSVTRGAFGRWFILKDGEIYDRIPYHTEAEAQSKADYRYIVEAPMDGVMEQMIKMMKGQADDAARIAVTAQRIKATSRDPDGLIPCSGCYNRHDPENCPVQRYL